MKKRTYRWLSRVMAVIMLLVTVPLPELKAQAAVEHYGVWVGNEEFTEDTLSISDKNGSGTAVFDKNTNTLTFNEFEGVAGEYEVGSGEYALVYTTRNISIAGKAVLEATGTAHNGFRTNDASIEFLAGSDISVTTEGISVYSPYMHKPVDIYGKLYAKTTGTEGGAIESLELNIHGGAEVTAEAENGSAAGLYADKLSIGGGTVNAVSKGADGKAIFAGTSVLISGGTVDASATGSNGIGISTFDIGISDGDITASGTAKAIEAGGSINLDSSMFFVDPVGGKVSTDGKKILKADDSEADSFRLVRPEDYDLWVGNTQVTSINKKNIPGILGGSASYDPGTGTLTFTGEVSGVEGSSTVNGFDAKIYAKNDLTIKGNVQLSNMDVQLGIGAEGKLVLDGNFRVSSHNWAVITTGSGSAPIVINGKLEASSIEANAVSAESDITIAGEGLVATTGSNIVPAVYAGKKLILESGVLDAQGDVYSIDTKDGIEFPAGYGITLPEDGKLSPDTKTVVESDGETVAKHARIEEVTFYDLWVGKTHVNSINAGEIPSVTGGKASYDPSTNILTFTGEEIAVDGVCTEDELESKIYTKSDLTIKGKVSLNYPNVQLGIGTKGKLVIDGNVSVSSKNFAVAAMGDDGSLEIKGRLDAQSFYGSAVSTVKGDISVAGEGLYAVSSSQIVPAVDSGKKLILTSGILDVEGGKVAINTKDGIEIPTDCEITIPEGGKLSADAKTVVGSDGVTEAKHARIEGLILYDLWVGETHVNSNNAENIPGVSGGTASYNPESKTLTFTGDECTLGGFNMHDAYGAQIYAGDELTIEGKVKLDNAEALYGIYTKGKLTIAGIVEAAGKSHGVLAENSALLVTGTLNAGSEDKRGIEAADILVQGGSVTAKGWTTAVVAADITVRDGELTAQGENAAVEAKSLKLDGGNVNAYCSGDAAHTDTVKLTETLTILNGDALFTGNTTTKNNVLTATGGIVVNGGSLTVKGEATGGHTTLHGIQDSALTVSGGTVSIEMKGAFGTMAIDNDGKDVTVSGGSLTIQANSPARTVSCENILVTGGSLSIQSDSTNYPVYCGNFTVTGGTVDVNSEGGATAIVAAAFHMEGGKLTADSSAGEGHAAIVTNSGMFTLGSEVTIVEPAGGRISDDASRIADAEGNEATKVVLGAPEAPAPAEDLWNLFESDARSFEIAALSSGTEVSNMNAKSLKFYDATLNGKTISVKLKSGVNRKQAAKPANTLLQFDLGAAGVVEYVIPVQYVKPAFKLSTKSFVIRDGADTTVKTRVLVKTEYGVYEPCDLSGMTIKYGSIDATGDADGYVSFKTSSAGKGAKLILDKPGVWESSIALKFTVKTSSKDVLSVDTDGRKTVLLNKNVSGQVFEFPVRLNGVPVTAETVEITKGSEVAELTADGNLKIAAKADTGAGNYTVTVSQKGGKAKVNIKVKVSDKAPGQAIVLKVRSKYDVVTGQKMLVEPQFKEAEVKILSVTSETDKYTAELDAAGNILIDYSGERNVKKLNIDDITLKLQFEGVTDPVSFTLSKVKAKKTNPKLRSAAVTLNKEATGEVKASVNVVCTYKDGCGRFHTIVPTELNLEVKKTEAVKNVEDICEIDILSLTAKSGSVKLKLKFAGGAEKKVSIKVKKAK